MTDAELGPSMRERNLVRRQLAAMEKLIALLEEGEDNELIEAIEQAQMEKELFLSARDDK
jgi:hypothetical protein